MVGVGFTAELFKDRDPNGLGKDWVWVHLMAATTYWVGVGMIVLPLARFALRVLDRVASVSDPSARSAAIGSAVARSSSATGEGGRTS